MATSGQEIVVSDVERIRFVQTTAETEGTLLEVQVTYEPHSPRPPAHFHPRQEEQFEVLRGVIVANIGGTTQTYKPGDTFTIPAGVVHWMYNDSPDMGEVRWQIRPALRTEAFFEALWQLQHEAAANKREPTLLETAVILQAHEEEFRLATMPGAVQRLLFGFLAWLGRRRGYRAQR